MPVQGFTRFRKHQFGRQVAVNYPVEAARAYAFQGTPDVVLNWTDQEVDTGSLDPTAAPYRTAPDLTANLTSPALAYNDVPLILSGFFGGSVSPTGGGTAKTWVYQPASTTVDEIDYFTYEFGDDVLEDWYQLSDGIVSDFEISGPAGLGPLTASANWLFGEVASTGSTDSPVTGTVPTPGLDVATDDAIIYLKDAGIYIADSTGGLGAGQVTDALESFTLRGSGDIDVKRWANATQSWRASALARATRMIEYEAVLAKTADTVGVGSESDKWMSDTAINRYLRMTFTSLVLAQSASTYHSWTFTLPLRYYTRTEGAEGGNTNIVLTGHAFYDGSAPVFDSTVVNKLTAPELDPGS